MSDIKTYQYKNNDIVRVRYDNVPKSTSMTITHSHNEYEMFYLISGQREYLVNDKIYHLKEGDIALINSNVIHRTIQSYSPGYERICFFYNKNFKEWLGYNTDMPDLLNCFNKNISVLRLGIYHKKIMQNIIEKLADECINKPVNYKYYIRTLMIELLIFINRCADDEMLHMVENNDSKYKKMAEILTYINGNYMYDITLPDISERFYISVSNLTRIFKLAMGCSLINYLNHYRILQAQSMLLQTNLSIQEIAQTVGYNNATHFGRKFKEINGSSPLKYRKINDTHERII